MATKGEKEFHEERIHDDLNFIPTFDLVHSVFPVRL